MSKIATIAQKRFGLAEKALLEAADYRALQIAWAAHCGAFDDAGDEYRKLLDLYHDREAQFAVEMGKFLRAG